MRPRDHIFFPALALLMSCTGFAGFSFTYFGPILRGEYPPAGLPLHVHGWSFFLWLLFLPLQALLIARGKRRAHTILGRLSPLLVVLMSATGILVLSVRVEEAVRVGEPRVWLLYGPLILSNLVLLVAFYAVGIWAALKGRLRAHKRLMIVATAAGLGAGLFRLILFLSRFHPLSLPAGTLGCSAFILLGAAYDRVAWKRIHAVYWIGLLALIAVEVPLLPQINAGGVAWINERLATIGEHLGAFYHPDPTVEF